jgi:RNA polymerase sigma-70 factor (ECF subfamily)
MMPPPGHRDETRDPKARTDAHLVALARSGSAHAFERLVRRHQQRAYRVALRMLGDSGEAEDATQDAFLQAWRGLARFRAQSSFGTWIYRIVTNRCLSQLRSRPVEQALMEERHASQAQEPSQLAEARGKVQTLQAALLRLSPEQRSAFVLRHLEGYSHEEISDVLGISVPAVKSRIHRARVELLARLEEWE